MDIVEIFGLKSATTRGGFHAPTHLVTNRGVLTVYEAGLTVFRQEARFYFKGRHHPPLDELPDLT